MNARLRAGMKVEEVISAFGQPNSGVGNKSGPSQIHYFAPIGSLTEEKEGYIGFEVQLVDGKVSGWRTFRGNPSYAPMKAPPEFKWSARFWVIVMACVALYGLSRTFWREASEEQALLKAYRIREIPTRQLPAEFRFITNDTTLQEVVDKAGPYSRVRRLVVDPSFASGFGLAEGPSGMPALVLLDYDLPYHAAVILLPEFPFELENRIRAAYYRPPRVDEEI